jgi:hypothetical protein
MFQTQLKDLADLARACPETTIVGPLAVGPYAGKREEAFTEWRDRIREVASLPNAYIKLGGLGMRPIGYTFFDNDQPPSSQDLEKAWRPYIETCIAAFDVRKQFPGRQGVQLSGAVECVQADRRRIFHRREDGAVQWRRVESLSLAGVNPRQPQELRITARDRHSDRCWHRGEPLSIS